MSNKGNFKRRRQLKSWKEVNDLIRFNLEYRHMKVLKVGMGQKYRSYKEAHDSPEFETFGRTMIIEEGLATLEITTRFSKGSNKVTTWVFDLNGEDRAVIRGQMAFAEMQKAYKVPDFREDPNLEDWYYGETGRFICSASPVVDFKPKYNRKRLYNVYEYDLNSAYTSVMLDGIPDTSSYRTKDYVREGEVGFIMDEKLTMIDFKGGFADFVFRLMPCPEELRKWLMKKYEWKKKSVGAEKKLAKAYLNFPIGYCQRINPFIRSYIVHKCNKRILRLIDDDTLFWNTDAIFSLRKRDDLDIGEDIGQFKELIIDSVYYNGNNYQIGLKEPTYRGIPKQWFKSFAKINGRPFDMEIDKPPMRMNLYVFDWDTLRIEKNQEVI